MSHFCYRCQRNVNVIAINNTVQCHECRDEFVEQLADNPDQNALFMRLFANMTNQSTDPRTLNEEHDRMVNGLPTFQFIIRSFNGRLDMGQIIDQAGNLGGFGDFAFGEHDFNEIIARLMEQADQEQTARISPEDILRLPMTQINEKQVQNGVSCITCMESFVLGERVVALECEHIFHRQCIEPWLRLRNTCPMCRSVIDPKKWPTNSTFDMWELD